MNKGVKLVIALLVVGVIAAVAIIFAGQDNGDDTANEAATNTNTSTENSGESSNATAAATITYDESGFSPAEVTVKSGDKVNFVNETDTAVEPASDPHPTHTTNSELNVGEVGPGETGSITVSTTGSWGYHNHFNSDETGTITVE